MNTERNIMQKEPNPPFVVEIIDTQPVEVKNPFSGEKATLQPTAVAVYDSINDKIIIFICLSASKIFGLII